jgi:hypothetical protein
VGSATKGCNGGIPHSGPKQIRFNLLGFMNPWMKREPKGNGTDSLQETPEDSTGPVRSEPLDLSNKAHFVFGKPETSTPRTSPKYSSSTPDSAGIVREWQGANTPLAETYFPTGFSRLPSPEDPECKQAVTLYSDKFEAISPPSDLEDLFVNFCKVTNGWCLFSIWG